MFFVLNRDKVYTYCISIITVILLFCVAHIMLEYEKEAQTVSTNAIDESQNICINFP